MRLPLTLLACVAGGIVSAIKMLAEELRGHVEKWKEGFEIFSRLCLTHTQKKFHQLRKLPPRTCPLAHITYLMHFISSALVKAFYGSITVIKLTTKVSKMKYHVLLYKHQ